MEGRTLRPTLLGQLREVGWPNNIDTAKLHALHTTVQLLHTHAKV